MKFLNFKEKETVLRVACARNTLFYQNPWIFLFPDLSVDLQKKLFDSAKKGLRDLSAKQGVRWFLAPL
ncbi:UNVERIFIED_CONTAM: hypothetical protein FKN15_077480 [Acipenser sinensis]